MDKVTEILNKVDAIFREALNEKIYQFPYEIDTTTTANVTYIRYIRDPNQIVATIPNSAIMKVDESGATTIITWADGDRNFDNVWGNRATTITYKPLTV